MKASYPSAPTLFNSPSNGTTLVMRVDQVTGNWVMPPEYPRCCGYSAQVGMDIFSPVMWTRECEAGKAVEGKCAQQSVPTASTTRQQIPSSAPTSSSLLADPTHGIPLETNSRYSNRSAIPPTGEVESSAESSRDMALPGRRQRNATATPLPCADRSTGANVSGRFDGPCESPEREGAKSRCSFADLYVSPKEIRSADLKGSTLFSTGAIATSPEEVIFPKRKDRADRNAWRDWTNSGYADWIDDCQDGTDRSGNSDVSPPDSYADTNVHAVAIPSSLPDDEVSAERLCVWNTEESSASSFSSGCDSSDAEYSCSGDFSFSYDALQSESKAMSEGDSSNFSVGSVRNLTRKEQRSRCDGQKLSPRFRGVWCKQRSFNQNCTAGNFPPPLESLSRHKSQRPDNQMPWVQLQRIRSQGRFMLQKVEVTQPVVFQPIRENGRLVLQLVNQDDDVEDRGSMTSDERQLTSPVKGNSLSPVSPLTAITPGTPVTATPLQHVGENRNRTDAISEDKAESKEREADAGEIHADTRKKDEVETHQLPENLNLPKKQKWKRAVKAWPESRGVASSAVAGEWMEQKVMDEPSSFASTIQILDRNRSGSFHPYNRDRAPEAKPSLAVYESIIRDSFLSFTTAHSFLRSLSGNADSNLSDFTSKTLGGSKTFLCGGIGKSAHGNTFCQQSPCVS